MKKLFLIVALITFGLSANAQSKKAEIKSNVTVVNPIEEATKDAKRVQEILGLNDAKTQDFIGLFQLKYETLAVKDLSDVRKAELSRIIDLKMRASLDANQMATLEADKTFYSKLIN